MKLLYIPVFVVSLAVADFVLHTWDTSVPGVDIQRIWYGDGMSLHLPNSAHRVLSKIPEERSSG
jgi:hypothetical protein